MSLFRNGIYLLKNLPSAPLFYKSLTEAASHVESNLYIDFLTQEFREQNFKITDKTFHELIGLVYNRPREICAHLNVHILLPPSTSYKNLPRKTLNTLDGCILADSLKTTKAKDSIQAAYKFDNFSVAYINSSNCMNNSDDDEPLFKKVCNKIKAYNGVVIGGTFDRIHDGHRLLVSKSLLLANEKFTCGVADGPLLEKKILTELIEPVNVRINNIIKMVEDYKPGLKHKVVALTDICGPSGTDDDLQLLVASEETKKGGNIVNKTRTLNGLQTLDIELINMVEDNPNDLSDGLNKEGKVSSSAYRVRLLGSLRKEPNFPKQDDCYIIGITGGIASGKSSIVKRLQDLGAYTIDCDKLGHEAYLPGHEAYKRIIEHFGESILNEDNTIDRKKLGPLVFGDKKELEMLNSIVWPEILQMMEDIIKKIKEDGTHNVIVYEAAIIFESGWDKRANEVWSCVVPKEEAVKRIQNRNGLSAEQAESRIAAQMENKERVQRSHVILSTLWEPKFTQCQVEKSWQLLQKRISN